MAQLRIYSLNVHECDAALLFKVSLIDTNLKSENIVKKIATGSVASLDFWKDTLILGSRCVQFINVKKFEWILSYEDTMNHDNVSTRDVHACQVPPYK